MAGVVCKDVPKDWGEFWEKSWAFLESFLHVRQVSQLRIDPETKNFDSFSGRNIVVIKFQSVNLVSLLIGRWSSIKGWEFLLPGFRCRVSPTSCLSTKVNTSAMRSCSWGLLQLYRLHTYASVLPRVVSTSGEQSCASRSIGLPQYKTLWATSTEFRCRSEYSMRCWLDLPGSNSVSTGGTEDLS